MWMTKRYFKHGFSLLLYMCIMKEFHYAHYISSFLLMLWVEEMEYTFNALYMHELLNHTRTHMHTHTHTLTHSHTHSHTHTLNTLTHTHTRLVVHSAESVPVFGPSLPVGGAFCDRSGFRDFLLTKCQSLLSPTPPHSF